jgi:uncharacterized membrane protein YfcA
VTGLLPLGFFFWASIGAIAATRPDGELLRRIFGGLLLSVAVHMMFGRHAS